MEIEVCTNGIEDTIKAVAAGATRIELCSSLEVQGITPTIANYVLAASLCDALILAFLRPRSGDFVYSNLEFEVMKRDALNFYNHGARDFVFGILTADNKIDIKRCRELISMLDDDCTFTFHKAFDLLIDLDQGIQELIDLGFTRVLTSGGFGSTADNLPVLKHLIDTYGNEIEVMPGGGVNADNIDKILAELEIKSIHFSAKKPQLNPLDPIVLDEDNCRLLVNKINNTVI